MKFIFVFKILWPVPNWRVYCQRSEKVPGLVLGQNVERALHVELTIFDPTSGKIYEASDESIITNKTHMYNKTGTNQIS